MTKQETEKKIEELEADMKKAKHLTSEQRFALKERLDALRANI